jgi:hypothetical protein
VYNIQAKIKTVYNIQAKINYTHKLPISQRWKQIVKTLNEVKHKVLLICDSHAWNCVHLLQDNLNSDFKFSNFVKSGARMNEVINMAREELNTLNTEHYRKYCHS